MIGPRRSGAPVGVMLGLLLAAAYPTLVAAEDPGASSAPDVTRPATCAARFPAEGPAGVDLRLGCIVGELVGLYTAAADADPAPVSTWALATAALLAAVAVVVVLAVRAAGRRAGRRLAPVLPSAWWVCERCHSVNAADARRCYACGAPPGTGPMLATSERPETPQSFGDRSRG